MAYKHVRLPEDGQKITVENDQKGGLQLFDSLVNDVPLRRRHTIVGNESNGDLGRRWPEGV